MDGIKVSHYSQILPENESVTVFDESGPVLIKSLNISLPPYGPASVRAQRLTVYVDEHQSPVVDVPILDLAGLTHGRITSMVTHYAECSGSTVTLRWPFSARSRMKIVVTNESESTVPLAFFATYQTLWAGHYIAAVMVHREPDKGQPVVVSLPQDASTLLGVVIAVRPSDLEWCGEGRVLLGSRTLADGLDMLAGTCLDSSQWFGSDRGISVSVRLKQDIRGHEFLGIYRWFIGGLDLDADDDFKIEQLGRSVSFQNGVISSVRVPRKDNWDILLVTQHHRIPDITLFNYELAEVDSHLGRRDYEISSFRDHLWSTLRNHVKKEG